MRSRHASMSFITSVEANNTPRSEEHTHERSEERRVGKSVDLGGRRIIKKKKLLN